MKKAVVGILAMVLLGVGGWYYLAEVHATPIAKIVANPRDYAGKEIAIAGRVSDRFSFFVIKYFALQDQTGEMIVVTDQPLPAVGTTVRVKGHIEEGFSLADQQALVFVESRQ